MKLSFRVFRDSSLFCSIIFHQKCIKYNQIIYLYNEPLFENKWIIEN